MSGLRFQIIDWYGEDYEDSESASESESSESSESCSDQDSDDNYKKKYKKKPAPQDTSKYKIYMFGKDLNEKTYTLEVNNFTPYFYIKLPDNPRNKDKYLDKESEGVIKNYVKEKMWYKYRNCLKRVTILYKHSFRNFDNFKKYRFARLVFTNKKSMRNAVSIFRNSNYNPVTKESKPYPKEIDLVLPGISQKKTQYDLYENTIDPLIKFIHHANIKPVGWIEIKPNAYEKSDNDKFRSDYFITADWKSIKGIDDNNTKIKVMAFDIECDSSHGDFPLPIKDYMKVARELYNNYMKYNQLYIKSLQSDKSNAANKRKYKNIIENRDEFASVRIESVFADGSEEYEMSKVFIKSSKKPPMSHIKLASKRIATCLTVSQNTNSVERKRHSTRCINKINKILCESFSPVKGDQTVQIGMSFLKYGEFKPYKNYMLTYDPSASCDEVKNAQTESFNSESKLLLRFKDIILQEDPEIITGWNTDGFDTPWLFKRAIELGIEDRFNYISKMTTYKSILKEKQIKGPTGELITKEYIDIPGRIQMDMLPLVQKGYNLDSYKLDNVSATFINGKILNIEVHGESTTIYTDSVEGLNNGNYIVFNEKDGYLENKYDDGNKFQITNLDKSEKTFEIPAIIRIDKDKFGKYSWCLGKDDVTPQDIFRLQKEGAHERGILANYCMMDVILCLELLLKLSLLSNNIGMANVCLNPLSWIIQRGQGIKILSLTAYFLKNNNYLLPTLYKDTLDKDGYEGAVVLNPNPGIYINKPVVVLDFGSLYPSCIIERNLSHDSIVSDKDTQYLGEEGAKLLQELGYGYEDVTYDIFKTLYTATGNVKSKLKVGERTVRFVQFSDPNENGKKGMMGEILRYLLKARKDTRNKIKYKTIVTEDNSEYIGLYNSEKHTVKTPDNEWDITGKKIISIKDTYTDFQKQNFDGEQLAYKVTANSLYGQMGAKTSDIYYKDIAAATTATGRERLMQAQEYAENPDNYIQELDDGTIVKLKNKVVYGDTDSVFVHFDTIGGDGLKLSGRDARKKSIELGIYTEQEIQKQLRKPQVLEYEKVFDPFILLSKKRYVGNLYETNPDKFKLKSMGIVLKRRDNAPIVKIAYGGVIDIIMKQESIKPAIVFLKKTLRDLIAGKFPIETLILSKTLSSYYKDPDKIAHKVLADRIAERDPGNKPQVNDRIQFAYINTSHVKGNKSLLQGDKIETPEFIRDNKLTPDYEFYITNQIQKPLSQIFGLVLEEIPGFTKQISEFNSIYDRYIQAGKSVNESLKKMLDKKNTEAGDIIFRDILRILANKRQGFREIGSFFKTRTTINEYSSSDED